MSLPLSKNLSLNSSREPLVRTVSLTGNSLKCSARRKGNTKKRSLKGAWPPKGPHESAAMLD